MTGTPTAINDVAPTRGQHTDWVLRDVLGMSAEDVAGLRADAVVT